MHLVAIRKDAFERNPWIAGSLFRAFEEAKDQVWQRICYTGAQKYMLPWLYADIDEVRNDFNSDPWPYGIEPNRPTLLKAVEYMHRDNMIDRRPTLQELFVDVDA
jgi:4,5-dihydroxyphthalate decarboxylase